MRLIKNLLIILVSATFFISSNQSMAAEATELRLAQQFGIGYLPFLVMQKQSLIEKYAQKNGLDNVKISWIQLGGGASMNDALLSNNLDFAAAGIPVFLSLWSKTKGESKVRVAAGLNNIPVFLNTANPNIRSLKDFTNKDKIALPAVKVSLQAIVLQMAAAKEWGNENYSKLDNLTVSMKHPDGMIALLSGKSEITAHFTTPPYMFQELENPKIKLVINSADLLGQHNFNVVYTTNKFREANPRLYKSFIEALDESMKIINSDKKAAGRIYIDLASLKGDQVDLIDKIVVDPRIEFTSTPNGLMKFANFMHQIGRIDSKPATWQELCFPEAAMKSGS